MNTRFIVLTILTSLFQVICLFALIGGLALAFGNQTSSSASNDLLAQVPVRIRSVAGLMLAFYALAGLVFSGGIHVLISTNEKAHAASEALAAMLARLKEAPVAAQAGYAAPRHDAPVSPTCPRCGASNDAHSRFCEVCGAAQPAS